MDVEKVQLGLTLVAEAHFSMYQLDLNVLAHTQDQRDPLYVFRVSPKKKEKKNPTKMTENSQIAFLEA